MKWMAVEFLVVKYSLYSMERKNKKKRNIGQSDVNLGPLALPSSRIPLMQGGVYNLP
jgi:hypothetical protein